MHSIQSFGSHFRQMLRLDHPLEKGILGRIALCAGLEVIGGMIGAYGGSALMRRGLSKLSGRVIPLVVTGALSYGLFKKPKATTIALLGIMATGVSLSALYAGMASWGGRAGLVAGTWVGKNVGTILGGYAALWLTRTTLPFWDRTLWAESYAVGMTKHILAGEIFNAVIARSTLPLVKYPLNLMRSTFEVVFKALAYHSNSLIATTKKIWRERRISQETLLPFAVKVLCHKYCEKNATPITGKLLQIFSRLFQGIPSAAEKLETILRTPVIFNQFEGMVSSLSKRSESLTNLLMRSFVGYVDLVRECPTPNADLSELKKALKERMPRATTLSQALSPICESTLNELSKSLLEALKNSEKDLTGFSLTNDTKLLEPLLSTHLKYYLIYTLLNFQSDPLTMDEEKDFFLKAEKTFFSIYKRPESFQPGHYWIEKTTHLIIISFFGFKKWVYRMIEQPEQVAMLEGPIQVTDGYAK